MCSAGGVKSESEGENCVKYAMISVEKVRRIETNNMYKIKIDTSWKMSTTTQHGRVTVGWRMGTNRICMWRSTISPVMIGCIDLLNRIVPIKLRRSLSGERISKCYILTSRWLYLWYQGVQQMEGLGRRKRETEGGEGRERWNEQIGRSVAGSDMVGIFFVSDNSIDNYNR